MELSDIVSGVQIWVENIEKDFHNVLEIETVVEEKNYLRYIIESENFIAELTVEPEGFHPHRFVCFEALDKRKDSNQKPYFYIDSEGDEGEEIIKDLNECIQYMII